MICGGRGLGRLGGCREAFRSVEFGSGDSPFAFFATWCGLWLEEEGEEEEEEEEEEEAKADNLA